MGLDIYVGSFTRYYAGDWETVLQQAARETGVEVQIVGRETAEDAITDPEELRPAILEWREGLSVALAEHLNGPLDWDESATAPYFTDKPAWDCYASLILFAAYAEHPELSRPFDGVEEWSDDPAVRISTDPAFQTAFGQLLRDVEIWLPELFPFTFKAEDPAGTTRNFGSSVALAAELAELNRRTWKATDEAIAEWGRNQPEHRSPLEIGARYAFSLLTRLARQAVEHRLIMMLDY